MRNRIHATLGSSHRPITHLAEADEVNGSGRGHPLHTRRHATSVLPVPSPNRIQQFVGVISDAGFENDFDVLYVRDLLGWIAFDHDQVCVLSGGDGTNLTLPAEVGGAVQ